MKKFGAFLLAGVLAIGALTGCGAQTRKQKVQQEAQIHR